MSLVVYEFNLNMLGLGVGDEWRRRVEGNMVEF